jgi:hypothetical protein
MDTLRRTPRPTIAAATAALLAVSLAFGYWVNVGNEDPDVLAWIIMSIIGSLIAAGLLLRFVPATEAETDGNAPARRALVLGVVAFVTVIGFWTGLPIALGVPALVLAAEGRARSATHGQGAEATAGAVLAGFAVIAAVVMLVTGS